ncbi:MAG: hypothetical protein AAGA80_16325 [Cyanobacteria bacterium P01_F01_bin.143]
MSQLNSDNLKPENLTRLAGSFEEAVTIVKDFALLEIQKQSKEKRLYYHTSAHAYGVQKRARIIFQAIEPFVSITSKTSLTRLKYLIDICAISHDMVQEFMPNASPNTFRRRKPGVSEAATISKLINYTKSIKIQSIDQAEENKIFLTNSDLQIIQEAIEATICLYDFEDNSMYQPALYSTNKKISLPAHIIALSDLGSLGIEGIEAYLKEGNLIFLEENPDIIPIILNKEYLNQPELAKKLKHRLLKKAKFQVNFARGREARFMREVTGLPVEAIAILRNEVFRFLNKDTIKKIESIIPHTDDTKLEELIEFFDLPRLI